MESLFPGILFLGPFFAPFIVRMGLALFFLWDGVVLVKNSDVREKARGAWSLLLTILLGVGLFTQLAAISGIIYTAIIVFLSKETGSRLKKKETALLAVFMLAALIIAGAGYTFFPFADVPY